MRFGVRKQVVKLVIVAVVIAAAVGALLVYMVGGCAASDNKGVDLSKLQAKNASLLQQIDDLSTDLRTPAGDDARITNITLTSVGGYGWGCVATLVGGLLWLQKRTRETAAKRIIRAIAMRCESETQDNVRDAFHRLKCRIKFMSAGEDDRPARWINRQVKNL